jgi:HSP20 family protein
MAGPVLKISTGCQPLAGGGNFMTLARWDPFRDVAALQDRINRLFEDAFPKGQSSEDEVRLSAWRPVVDIYATEAAVVFKVELPGVKKENISVEVKDNVLTIRGERVDDSNVAPDDFYRRERIFGTFSRSFSLQHAVDPERIKARFKEGVLEVQIPKLETEPPRQVAVSID